jgi:hypothetical protein
MLLGVKTVSEFFRIPETVSGFFRSKSSVSVFLGIGIGHRNFRSESELVQLFTDRFLRLPFWVGIYRIHNSEFTENVNNPAQVSNLQLGWRLAQQTALAAHHGRPFGPFQFPNSHQASATARAQRQPAASAAHPRRQPAIAQSCGGLEVVRSTLVAARSPGLQGTVVARRSHLPNSALLLNPR